MCRSSYRDLKYGDIIAKAGNNMVCWMAEDGLISVKIKTERMRKWKNDKNEIDDGNNEKIKQNAKETSSTNWDNDDSDFDN